jgi:hypothetical protein
MASSGYLTSRRPSGYSVAFRYAREFEAAYGMDNEVVVYGILERPGIALRMRTAAFCGTMRGILLRIAFLT